jgi:hypothetical protein
MSSKPQSRVAECGAMVADVAAALAGVAAVALLIADPAWAQAGDIAAGGQRAFTWAVTAVRVFFGLIFLAGFCLFAAGRFNWQSAFPMVIGGLGAVRADTIATYMLGA